MQISKLKHPQDNLGLILAGLLLLASGWINWWIPTLLLGGLGLAMMGMNRWLGHQMLPLTEEEQAGINPILHGASQKLKLEQTPLLLSMEPNNWGHRICMFLLKGQYVFVPRNYLRLAEKDDNKSLLLQWYLREQLAEIALGYTSPWRKFLEFPALLVPFASAFILKIKRQSLDRVQVYLMQGESIHDLLPTSLSYRGTDKGIALHVLTDAWQEYLLKHLILKAGFAWNGNLPTRQRKQNMASFDPEAAMAPSVSYRQEGLQASHSSLTPKPSYPMEQTDRNNRSGFSPIWGGIIGLILGIPLSYLFQSEALRNKLSMGKYLQQLPDIIDAAGRRDDMQEVVITLVITCLIFAFVGFIGVRVLNNRRRG